MCDRCRAPLPRSLDQPPPAEQATPHGPWTFAACRSLCLQKHPEFGCDDVDPASQMPDRRVAGDRAAVRHRAADAKERRGPGGRDEQWLPSELIPGGVRVGPAELAAGADGEGALVGHGEYLAPGIVQHALPTP